MYLVEILYKLANIGQMRITVIIDGYSQLTRKHFFLTRVPRQLSILPINCQISTYEVILRYRTSMNTKYLTFYNAI